MLFLEILDSRAYCHPIHSRHHPIKTASLGASSRSARPTLHRHRANYYLVSPLYEMGFEQSPGDRIVFRYEYLHGSISSPRAISSSRTRSISLSELHYCLWGFSEVARSALWFRLQRRSAQQLQPQSCSLNPLTYGPTFRQAFRDSHVWNASRISARSLGESSRKRATISLSSSTSPPTRSRIAVLSKLLQHLGNGLCWRSFSKATHDVFNYFIEFLSVDGLGNVSVHACFQASFLVAFHRIGRHGDDGNVTFGYFFTVPDVLVASRPSISGI